MSNKYHWPRLCQYIRLERRTLRHKHPVRILRLPEHVHYTTIERIGMISTLMIEGVPERAAHMLSRSSVQFLQTSEIVRGAGIMRCLYQLGYLSPCQVYPTCWIMRIPIINIITPLAGEVTFCRFHIIGRMRKQNIKIFITTRFTVTPRITIWIGIFFFYYVIWVSSKVGRIMSFIQNGLPYPYWRMITVTSHHIAYIRIYPLSKHRFIVPELPARSIYDYKQSQFIARVHKSRILRIMGIAYHF